MCCSFSLNHVSAGPFTVFSWSFLDFVDSLVAVLPEFPLAFPLPAGLLRGLFAMVKLCFRLNLIVSFSLQKGFNTSLPVIVTGFNGRE